MTDLLTTARQKGTDAEYRAFIQKQPSAISGQFSEWIDGEGRSIACHVRRAATSGTGYKAEFSCVPLTDREHKLTHQHGESCLQRKEWWDEQRIKYLRMWIES